MSLPAEHPAMRTLLPLLALLVASPLAAQQSLRLFSVGSGDVEGGYYAAANAICDAVNRAERGRLRCSPEPTSGSLYNLAALADGQLDFALVQSDWQKRALEGSSVFESRGAMENLRSVMSLYPEPFNLIVRGDAGIDSFTDLIGKRVDIGHPSSARQATMRAVVAAYGLDTSDFAQVVELPTGSAVAELCAGRIDATALIIGHPSVGIARALGECGAKLVPLAGPEIDALLAAHDDFSRVYVPMQAYPSMPGDVASFAVRATIVTLASENAGNVEALVTDTLAALEHLQQTTPILSALEPFAMREVGLTAPLHPAAEAAFANFLEEE
jgi:TRAP transporter TAXI family solute receptor